MALNAEKAFDNAQWDWLGLVLDKVGIMGGFCIYLKAFAENLYSRYTPLISISALHPKKRDEAGMPTLTPSV